MSTNLHPAYSEFQSVTLDLIPITTFELQKRRNSKIADLSNVIDPGFFLFDEGPEPLPPDWATFTHPEGSTYFYRSAGLRVVTEACMYQPEIMDKISSWASSVEDTLRNRHIQMPPTLELLLEPYPGLKYCGYYLVDHSTRSEFWPDKVSTEILDLRDVLSKSHLEMTLGRLYWLHVEYFPMHFSCVSSDLVDELLGAFSHGHTDRISSSTSTFPYDANASLSFIRTLKNVQERDIDGYATYVVAHLCNNIGALLFNRTLKDLRDDPLDHSRFNHYVGQESPRLGRDQSIQGTHSTTDHQTFHSIVDALGKVQVVLTSHLNRITSSIPYLQQVDARGSTFNSVQRDQHNIQITINNNGHDNVEAQNGRNKYPFLQHIVVSGTTLITTVITAAFCFITKIGRP